jgi:perosamine synthetase
MERLAALGGPKTITRTFAGYTSIGAEEIEAARAVVASGVLSRFLGCWGPDFYGGEKVRGLEEAWRYYFGSRTRRASWRPWGRSASSQATR